MTEYAFVLVPITLFREGGVSHNGSSLLADSTDSLLGTKSKMIVSV